MRDRLLNRFFLMVSDFFSRLLAYALISIVPKETGQMIFKCHSNVKFNLPQSDFSACARFIFIETEMN